jgi:hypothetical protein
VAEHRDQREIAAARAEQAEPDRTARSRSPRSTSTSTPGAGAWVDPVRVSRVSWDRPWDTKPVLPGPCVLWEPWGVPSVLVERHEHFDGALVMRKSRVRIPQAAPRTYHPRFSAVPRLAQSRAPYRPRRRLAGPRRGPLRGLEPGRSAGFRRNTEMVALGWPNLLHRDESQPSDWV